MLYLSSQTPVKKTFITRGAGVKKLLATLFLIFLLSHTTKIYSTNTCDLLLGDKSHGGFRIASLITGAVGIGIIIALYIDLNALVAEHEFTKDEIKKMLIPALFKKLPGAIKNKDSLDLVKHAWRSGHKRLILQIAAVYGLLGLLVLDTLIYAGVRFGPALFIKKPELPEIEDEPDDPIEIIDNTGEEIEEDEEEEGEEEIEESEEDKKRFERDFCLKNELLDKQNKIKECEKRIKRLLHDYTRSKKSITILKSRMQKLKTYLETQNLKFEQARKNKKITLPEQFINNHELMNKKFDRKFKQFKNKLRLAEIKKGAIPKEIYHLKTRIKDYEHFIQGIQKSIDEINQDL